MKNITLHVIAALAAASLSTIACAAGKGAAANVNVGAGVGANANVGAGAGSGGANMSASGQANTNGRFDEERQFGQDRAAERRSAQGTAHEKGSINSTTGKGPKKTVSGTVAARGAVKSKAPE